MSILESIVLGIVQGLTEFLPVSSSGHLVLLQNIFGFAEPQLFFDTMLHLGTLVAVVVVMWRNILELFRKPFTGIVYLIIATIPAVVVTLFFGDFFESTFAGTYLGYGFLLTACILSLSEVLSKRAQKKRAVKAGSAVVMGVMQAIAIFPGVSRAGSTISGGLLCGIDRKKAAEFSFLMSIPAILGSVVLQGYKLVTESNTVVDWIPTLIGMICAAVAGYFAVRFMIAMITRKRLYGFAIYVAVVGLFVLLDQNVFGLINWV